MKRLSEPLGTVGEHYEVVVVGSGYGGGIAASRLARAGRRPCLLERGREHQPGEYPDNLLEVAEQSQVTAGGRHTGARSDLYDLRVWDDIGMLVGCGLGGTSLINANVSLPADPRVFEDPRWPRTIREDPDGMARGYRLATEMLRPSPTPDAPELPKLATLARSAAAVNGRFYRPPVNVTFADGPSPAGVEQKACVNCGDCVTGCNHRAKNTTLMNYLPDAHNHGAQIHTEIDVRWVEPAAGGGWHVHYHVLGTGGERFDAPTQFVHADLVVLAAGSVGTTEILLRSREHGLATSPVLGERFTGNGDVLAFAYNTDDEVRSVGFGDDEPATREPVGPCIAGIIDLRDTDRLEDGFVIEEGAIPGALGPILAPAFAKAAAFGGEDTDTDLLGELDELRRGLDSLVRGPDEGAINNTQVYLVMSHDDGAGRIELEGDRAKVIWPDLVDQPIFAKVDDALRKASAANGGTFLRNPLRGLDRLVTVHPLGGAVMGDDATSGVCDHAGRVFRGPAGAEVHDGLVVCDGALIPRPLGVNPLLTISALAERAMAELAAERGWTIDETPTSSPRADAPEPEIGIRFTERMAGTLSLTDGTEGDFDFILAIVGRDLDALIERPGTRADLFGTIRAKPLSPDPFSVHEGAFQLLPGDPDRVESRLMVYDLAMQGEDGRAYRFHGEKHIHDDLGPDLWEDTTRLEFTVADEAGGEVGRGVLRIQPADLARQLRTMTVTGARGTGERLEAALRFGRFFAGALYDTYGAFGDARPFAQEPAPRKRRVLRAPFPELHPLRTDDGVDLRLTRYPGNGRPVLLGHGLGVGSSIFTIDTIPTNLVEHLCAEGWDVWLVDLRASVDLPASRTRFTADDVADHDWPAAVAYVRSATGVDAVDVIAHCFGATTFTMAVLAGMTGVRSAVISQISAHVDAPAMTRLKAGLHMPEVLDALGVESLTADVDGDEPWWERLYDGALRLWPRDGDEQCDSPVCHRITFMYGQLYEHARLNQATHEALGEMFGVGNMDAFAHLARLVRERHLVGADGSDRYMPHLDRLAALPLTIIHGEKNHCFLPSSTERTMKALDAVGGAPRARHVIPGYGHIDCMFGATAHRDVYQLISAHLQGVRT